MKIAAVLLGLALGFFVGGMLMGGSPGDWGASTGCGCEDVLAPAARPSIIKEVVVDESDS